MRLDALYLTGALSDPGLGRRAAGAINGAVATKFPGDYRCSANDSGGRHLRPRLALGGSSVRQAQPMASRALRTS